MKLSRIDYCDQAISAVPDFDVNEKGTLDHIAAALHGIGPRDELEDYWSFKWSLESASVRPCQTGVARCMGERVRGHAHQKV